MKKSINLNVLLATYVVEALEHCGVHDVVVSPGSRSTPLIIALDESRKIRTHVVIDERSNGYFALGLAKSSLKPVAIITTSGTAVAELYPSVIEAFQQRIPLIICSADRPEHLVNTGANQTIDQINIYGKFCNYFLDSHYPKATKKYFKKFNNEFGKTINTALFYNPGPVQINLRFEQPFEKSSTTHTIDKTLYSIIRKLKPSTHPNTVKNSDNSRENRLLFELIEGSKRTLIMVGHSEQDEKEKKSIIRIAKLLKAPVIADGLSNLRFGNNSKNLLINSTAFFRNRNFIKAFDPDLIVQFAGAATSNIMLHFFEKSKAKKVLINQHGDIKDPSRKYSRLIKTNASELYRLLRENKISVNLNDIEWYKALLMVDASTQNLKQELIEKSGFPSEARIINELLNSIPSGSNLMVSNSLVPRDVDYFANANKKNIKLYHNRGTSGIDGIISTAAGITSLSENRTFLLIGDLAFLHDINGLWLLKQYNIPLTIILVNNGGGSIFEMLPIAKEKINFSKYFKVPPSIDFKKVVKSFEGNHISIKNWNHLAVCLGSEYEKFTVLEIKSSSVKSLEVRKKYWGKVISSTQRIIDEYTDK